MSYVLPSAVASPKAHWNLLKVILDTGENTETNQGFALAVGQWDGNPCLALRWNGGRSTSLLGNPQSRGLPTWLIVPEALTEKMLSLETIPDDMRELAKTLLQLRTESRGGDD